MAKSYRVVVECGAAKMRYMFVGFSAPPALTQVREKAAGMVRPPALDHPATTAVVEEREWDASTPYIFHSTLLPAPESP